MVAAFGDGRCLLLVAAASGARNAKRDDDPPAKTKPRPPHPWITPRDSPAALNSILVPCPELLGISCANARESRNRDSTNRRPSATKFSPFARFGEKYGAGPSANSDTLAQRTVCAAHAFFGKAARRHGFDVRYSTKRTRRETETNDITSAATRLNSSSIDEPGNRRSRCAPRSRRCADNDRPTLSCVRRDRDSRRNARV